MSKHDIVHFKIRLTGDESRDISQIMGRIKGLHPLMTIYEPSFLWASRGQWVVAGKAPRFIYEKFFGNEQEPKIPEAFISDILSVSLDRQYSPE